MIYGNFNENLRKTFLTHFVSHFSLIDAKTKMKMKKIGKTSSIFEFSISKLGYMEVFMKIWEKMKSKSSLATSLSLLSCLTFTICLIKMGKHWCQNEDEDEKIWKMNLIFESPISKLGYRATFMKILRKNILINRHKNENVNEKIGENEFDFWIHQIKFRLHGNFHICGGKNWPIF